MKASNLIEPQDCTKQNIALGIESSSIFFTALLMLLSALIFSVSPMNGEDYALTKQFTDASLFERVSWAIERSIQQSTHWNARLGEQLSIFWLAMPRVWFAIANLISISSLALLLALFATPQEKWNRKTLMVSSLLVMAGCFLLWPRLEIFFWRTTAAGYLQPLVMTLLLLLPFYSLPACRLLLSTWLGTVVFFLLGLLCGLSFENVPPALLPYMALITFLHFREKTEFRMQLGLMVLIYLLGWALLMMAPSTHARTAYYISALNVPAASLGYFYHQALAVLHAFVEVSAPLLATLFIVLLISLYLKTGAWRQSARFYLLLVPAGLCVASVVKAPYIEPRAFTLAWTILIIVIVRLLHELLQKLPDRLTQMVIICIGIVSVGIAGQVFAEYLEYSRKVSWRTELIISKQNSNECREGLAIQLIPSRSDVRLLNNREEWVASSLPQVSKYFNCQLRLGAQ